MTSSVREWLNLARAVVPRLCRNHVGRPDLLLHLAGRPILQSLKRTRRARPRPLDGPQRRFLHRRKTEIAARRTRTGALVPLGSGHDMAERNGADVHGLLLQRWIDRSRRGGHFSRPRHRHRNRRAGFRLAHLRSGAAVGAGQVRSGVRNIFIHHHHRDFVRTWSTSSAAERLTSTSAPCSEPSWC